MIELVGVLDDGSLRGPGMVRTGHQTIRVVQGADTRIVLRVLGGGGSPLDVTGATFALTVKKAPTDLDPLIQVRATGGGRQTEIVLESEHTVNLEPGRYVYDVWLERDGHRDPIMHLSALLLEPAVAL